MPQGGDVVCLVQANPGNARDVPKSGLSPDEATQSRR